MILNEIAVDAPFESTTFTNVEIEAGTWTAFDGVAGQVATSGSFGVWRPSLQLDQVGREVETLGVTSLYFRVLGLPIRGRDLTQDDNRTGAEPVAVISDRLWATVFARHSAVLGFLAAATPFPLRIVGVAPAGFHGVRRGEDVDVWIPSRLVPRLAPAGAIGIPEDALRMLTFGRLLPRDSVANAKQRFLADTPDQRVGKARQKVQLVPLGRLFGTPDSRTLIVSEERTARLVAGVAGLVVLGGCATLMALVLVHYEQRRHELSVRLALGAGRARLVAELVRELGWLIAASSAAATAFSSWFLQGLPAVTLPGGVDLSRLDLAVDWRVILASGVTTAATLAVAACVPIRQFTQPNLARQLAAFGSTTARSSQRFRQMLLGFHVTATVVVLVVCGLFVRSVTLAFGAGPGFDIDNTVYVRAQVAHPFVSMETNFAARKAFVVAQTERLATAFRSLPGVTDVALGEAPIGPDQARLVLAPRQIETAGAHRQLRVGVLNGSAGLLNVLGVPIRRGRGLTDADSSMGTPVVVTESLARSLWPSEVPLGQSFSLGPRRQSYSVVGTVPDFVYGSLSRRPAGVMITDGAGEFGIEPNFVIRAPNPELLAAPIHKLVRDLFAGAPKPTVMTGREVVARDVGRERLGAWFFSGFGLVSLLMGAGSVFGLVSYSVGSRRREFGIRLVLGSTRRELFWTAARSGFLPASAGVAAGLVLSTIARGLLPSLPVVDRFDMLTFIAVSILIVGAAAMAGFLAAWRVRDIAPSETLRAQ
jgi:predicted permease